MNPDVIFIVGMVVLIASGFVVYKIISRARAKKLRAEYAARWERDQEQASRTRNMILDRDAALVARRTETRKVAELYAKPVTPATNTATSTSTASSSSSDILTTVLITDMLFNHSSPSTARSSVDSDDTTSKRSVDTGPSYSDSSSSSSSYSDSSPSYSDDSSSSSSSSFD